MVDCVVQSRVTTNVDFVDEVTLFVTMVLGTMRDERLPNPHRTDSDRGSAIVGVRVSRMTDGLSWAAPAREARRAWTQ